MAAIDLNRSGIDVSQFTDSCGYSSTLMKMLLWMPVDVSHIIKYDAFLRVSNQADILGTSTAFSFRTIK